MKILFPILSLLFLVSSCVKNNPDPSWIKIENWKLNENLNITAGELSQNFSEVYVTVDDKIIGYFELPVKLPLLMDGQHKITLYPAIRNNGISATKKIYPFVEPYVLTVNLVQNQVIDISPETKYYDGTQFWIEDFENSTFKIDQSSPSTMGTLTKDNNPLILKYGNFFGNIEVNSVDSVWFGKTSPSMTLPKGGAEVYLEIDYMNTNSLLTGVYANSVNGTKDNPDIQLNAQDATTIEWKKIYIDLKEIISSSTSAISFDCYFKVILDEELSVGNIYIDNIKVVHF